jgi:hypothetical protein
MRLVITNLTGSTIRTQTLGALPGNTTLRYTVNLSDLLRFGRDIASQAQGGNVTWYVQDSFQDVTWYGADPTGSTNSLPAFNAATRGALAAGFGNGILIPCGLFQTTGPWVIGTKFVNENELDLAAGFDTITTAPSFNSSNYNIARAQPKISILSQGGVIWANYTNATESAAVNYSLPSEDDVNPDVSAPFIKGLTIVGPAGYSGGVMQNPNTSVEPTTNVSGLFVGGAQVEVSRCTARELNRGFVFGSSFWSLTEKCAARHCVNGFDFLHHNAGAARNLRADYCVLGYTITGQNVKMGRLDTEQCRSDMYVGGCDQASVKGTYFEATGSDYSDYSIKLGSAGNLLLWSQALANFPWSSTSSGAANTAANNTAAAPDGSNSATTITFNESVPPGSFSLWQQNVTGLTASESYTFRAWLKQGSGPTTVTFEASPGGSGGTTGTQTVTLTSNWQEVTVTAVCGSGGNILCRVGNPDATGTVLVWGTSLVHGTSAGSYRKSTVAPAFIGNGCFFLHLEDSHIGRTDGNSCDMTQAQMSVGNTRWYPDAAHGVLMRDNGCVIAAYGLTSLPINPASYTNNGTAQTSTWIHAGIAVTFQAGIAAGETREADITVAGARVGDNAIAQLPAPAGWLVGAVVTADDTVRVSCLNATGASADWPTTQGFVNVQPFTILT